LKDYFEKKKSSTLFYNTMTEIPPYLGLGSLLDEPGQKLCQWKSELPGLEQEIYTNSIQTTFSPL